MKPRQADVSLKNSIIRGCVRLEPAMDFRSAQAAGLDGMPDPEVLALAARDGRILVTHDVRTMPSHFSDFTTAAQIVPGVFIIPQHTPVAQAIEDLWLIWAGSDAEEWLDRLVWLPL